MNPTRSALAAIVAALASLQGAVAQSGDTCLEAIPITLPFNASTNLSSATSSGGMPCGGSGWPDRWYVFTVPTVPNTTYAELTLGHFQSQFESYSFAYAVYRANDCGDLAGNQVFCSGGFSFENTAEVINVAQGEQYYLRVAADTTVTSLQVIATLQYFYECSGIQSINLPGVTTITSWSIASAPFSCGASFDRVAWWQYSARCDGVLEVDTCDSARATVLEAYSSTPGTPGCGQFLACDDGACGLGGRLTVPVVAGQTVRFRVGARSGDSGEGRLRVLEPAWFSNFTCGFAVPLDEGTYDYSASCLFGNPFFAFPSPVCGDVNNSFPSAWYRYDVVGSGSVLIDACASDLPVTLEVWSGCPGATGAVSIHCSDSGCGAGGIVGSPFVGTAVPGDVLYFRLYVRQAASATTPLQGNLRFVIDEPSGPLGFLVCDGEPNSVGDGADLTMQGSASVTSNDLLLEVSELPLSSMGYFVVSQSAFTLQNPGGSQGDLCIASLSMGRYAGQVLDSGALGEVGMPIDLTAIPLGGVTVVGQVGETWHWQYWYRDQNPTSTSNFSSARGLVLE